MAKYSLVRRWLHWWLALLVLGMYGLGLYMTDLSYYDPWYHDALELHRAIGVFVFGFLVWRTIAMVTSAGLPLPAGMARWERVAAVSVKHLLGLLPFLLILTGYLVSTAAGNGFSVFGWFEVPALFGKLDGAEDALGEVHELIAHATIGLAILHAAAAIRHQWIKKDNLLRRML